MDANGVSYTGAGIYSAPAGTLGLGNDREVGPGLVYTYLDDNSPPQTISADWRNRMSYSIGTLNVGRGATRYYWPDGNGPYSNPYQGFNWGAQAIGPYDTCFSMNVDASAKTAVGTRGDPRVLAGLETVTDSSGGAQEFFKNSFKDYNAPSISNFIMNEYGSQSYLQGCNANQEGPQPTTGYVPYTTAFPRTTAGAQEHALSLYNNTWTGCEWSTGIPYLDFTAGASDKVSLFNIPMATWGKGGGPYLMGNSGTPGNYTYGGYPGEVGAIAYGLTENLNSSTPPGDFMNGSGSDPDGGFIVYPDQNFQTLGSDVLAAYGSNYIAWGCWMPFFQSSQDYGTQGNVSPVLSYFSPNREVTSPVVFGSIPAPDTGGNGTPQPWTTLLFCPNPVAPSSGRSHPGFGIPNYPPYTTIPDHLFLDLFWMPVVEPYPISEAFSTAGKINLNYQIVPFTYVTRQTGLYAVMKSTKITAIPSTPSTSETPGSPNVIADYKNNYILRTNHPGIHTRFNIDNRPDSSGF